MSLKQAHVVHVTTAHAAEDVRIFHREAKLLVPHCGRVTVVAADCGGTHHGVDFVAWAERSPRGRLARVRAAGKAAKTAADLRAQLYHFHDPELMVPMGALARKRRVPVIYDVHEHYRGTLYENSGGGLRGRAAAVAYGLAEWYSLGAFAGIVTVTPQIAAMYVGRARRVALVRNLPNMDDIVAATSSRTVDTAACRLVYSGSVSQRALYPLAEAVRSLVGRFPSITVRVVGDFRDQVERERMVSHWRQAGVADRLRFVGRMPREAFLESLSGDSVGLVLFWPTPNAGVALPNKLFEYMACGLPVVVPNLPNQRAIVEEYGCGVWCDTTEPGSIAAAITGLLEDPEASARMGERGRQACQTTYRADADLPALTTVYEDCLKDVGALE